ncbi:MAG TPA: ATP-binding protein [archaeon]|nr:ATP-binding protein [archaeon]
MAKRKETDSSELDAPNDSGEKGKVLEMAVKTPLGLLSVESDSASEQSSFVGRKKNDFKDFGFEASVFLGRVADKDFGDRKLFMDTLSPHVVFICGARGVGKSYTMGVLVEDLASNNSNVGIVVVDPIGIYWSMKKPNKDKKEIEALADWGLVPKGLENLKVFIPEGAKAQAHPDTFDAFFTVAPALLTTDDWCLTFDLERFSPAGLLLEKALSKVKTGYASHDGKSVAAKKHYSLDDLIQCLETDSEITSMERGFKKDSIRALVSRLDAAKSWGVFSAEGTPLAQLSRPGQVSVLDISFLEENVSSLVIGILARRLLTARKVYTRSEALSRLDEASVESFLETEIPPTWLLIDEAHTLIPGGNVKTAASTALIEYVKQGRRPGCSLVFATQQPGAIDAQVLSQVDVMISHKLIFGDDIKAVAKRMPSIMPAEYMNSAIFKALPIGYALLGDRREETSRTFLMRVRPRTSQHEGRETKTLEMLDSVKPDQVLSLVSRILENDLRENSSIPLTKVKELLDTFNHRYKLKILFDDLLAFLETQGFVVGERELSKEGLEAPAPSAQALEETALAGEPEAVGAGEEKKAVTAMEPCFKPALDAAAARGLVEKRLKKKLFGLVGEEETLFAFNAYYVPVLEVSYSLEGEQKKRTAFVDLDKIEFSHFTPRHGLVYSRGLASLADLDSHAVRILSFMKRKGRASVEQIQGGTGLGPAIVRSRLAALEGKKLVQVDKSHKPHAYKFTAELDLPKNGSEQILSSMQKIKIEAAGLPEDSLRLPRVDHETVYSLMERVFGEKLKFHENRVVYLPSFEAVIATPRGRKKVKVDAFTGELAGVEQ